MVPEIWSVTDRIFCHCGPFFALLLPLTTRKIKIWKKWKKTPGDIIILHMCTTDDNHMMNGSWDMEYDGQNVLSFWTIFAIYHPKKPKKNKHLEISSFYTSVSKIIIICYTVPEILCVTDAIIILHFEPFFCPFTPLTAWKMKI